MGSMDDMMRMSFDELRSQVNPLPSSMSTHLGLTTGGRHGIAAIGMHSSVPRGQPVIPNHPRELEVYFCGPGAESLAAKHRSVSVIDKPRAANVCKGRRDFILFEPLDDCVKEGRRLVIVASLGRGQDLKDAQVYLASSLSRWLSEEKTDGSGRPYGETKDEDPTLRKHFTREQIVAIMSFGDECSERA
ncbi:hypothetical protein AB1Y20_021223 [Prymnesium parvum]|uniref:Uncharacterized protein n=1 Tax=Prymnesium parvum TaxID=97485 RepID=A0AB34JI57_PRYPA